MLLNKIKTGRKDFWIRIKGCRIGTNQTRIRIKNKELEKELEFEMASADCHLDAINTCKDWYFTHHVNPLNKELVNKSNLLST